MQFSAYLSEWQRQNESLLLVGALHLDCLAAVGEPAPPAVLYSWTIMVGQELPLHQHQWLSLSHSTYLTS